MDRRSTQIDTSDGSEWQMAITLETFSELCGTNPNAQYSSHVHRASSKHRRQAFLLRALMGGNR